MCHILEIPRNKIDLITPTSERNGALMFTVQPKKPESLSFQIQVKVWKLPRGHRVLPRNGVHRDVRKQARVNARADLRRSAD